MTRDEAIKRAEGAYPKEFLDFGDGRSDNRSECEILVDRLVLLGVLELNAEQPVIPWVDAEEGDMS